MATETLKAADGHSLSAYVTGLEDATRGLVVVQEIFGVNHHIRSVCERFAAKGYGVVAPALFDRAERGVELGYDEVARGRELRAKVPEAGLIADIEAAAARLEALPVGIVGYCWGGTVAWWGATRAKGFRAASCWYGAGIAGTRKETPRCPVQMHFGEKDNSIPLSDVEEIRAALPAAEIYIYPGAQHGFGCDERASFDPASADLAQQRTLAFFEANIRA
jgi:carboxymethylenebutenolidase